MLTAQREESADTPSLVPSLMVPLLPTFGEAFFCGLIKSSKVQDVAAALRVLAKRRRGTAQTSRLSAYGSC